jgi:hypothetical protein
MPTLADDPVTEQFRSHEEVRLKHRLSEIVQASYLYPVNNVRELLLDGQGFTLVGQSRLTTWALFQVCQIICPGLYKLINELAGGYVSDKHPRSDYSFAEAVDIYNRVVGQRFLSRLFGRQLMRSNQTNLIEGVVGSRYRWLSNFDLYENTRGVLDQERKPPVFCEATLHGRWMLLRYYNPRTLCVADGPRGEHDRFVSGYHFSNNEVGHASIKAAAMLIREMGRTASLSPSLGHGKVRHLGQRFTERLKRLLSGVIGRLEEAEAYRSHVLALQATSLRLGDEANEAKRRDDLVHQLVRRKLTNGLAEAVIRNVMNQDSYNREIPVAHVAQYNRSSRTAYDLYNAIGRIAKTMPINVREQLEQAAYALLVGKLVLN